MYICIELLTNQNFKMKKFANLFIVGLAMFAFTACGGGTKTTEEAAPAAEEVAPAVEEVVDTNAVEGDTTGHDHDHDHDHSH